MYFCALFTNNMKFIIEKTDAGSHARAGVISTDHGQIRTPIFMPVGTLGAVKAVHVRDLKEHIKAQIILGNTYHLYLRPGCEVLKNAGGLHKFNGWDRPILTDSGGFQVFSLSHRRKINPDEGVWFQSHIDGSRHLFSPESVMDTERAIGADIIMAFDECIPYPCEYEYARKSVETTYKWLKRCVKRLEETEPLYGYSQTLFPIVQGGIYHDLRARSAEYAESVNPEGIAIGGVAVGEPTEEMYEIADFCCRQLPKDKPRYLMGVGTPANIIENIALGVDMFDCVMPTRNGRNGMIFTWEGMLNLRNEKWKNDFTPIAAESDLFADREYTRAYLRHLYVSDEMLGPMIGSIHNLHFYIDLVTVARQKILDGTFASWKNEILPKISRRL